MVVVTICASTVRTFEARGVEGRSHEGECAIAFACVRTPMTWVRTFGLRLLTRAGETHSGGDTAARAERI